MPAIGPRIRATPTTIATTPATMRRIPMGSTPTAPRAAPRGLLDPERPAEQSADRRGIGLTARLLHDLPRQEADGLVLAGPDVGHGVRIGRDDLPDRGLERFA